MKKLSLRIIAVILSMCMILPIIPAWAFAGEAVQAEGNANSVIFKLEKVSETKETVTVKFVLTEGKTLCFDAQAQASETLTCTSITFSEAIRNFRNDNEDGFVASNINSGKFSFVNTVEISAPMDIVEITYSKSTAAGIKLSDISVSVDSCYFSGENGDDILADVTVVNEIPAEHTHVASGVWVETTPATCQQAGERVMYCTECGEVAKIESIAKKDHTLKTVRVEATCEKDGYVAEVCSSCNQEISRTVLPKTGHKNTVNQHKDATCTENGYDRIYCNDCKTYIKNTVIPATNHANTEKQHKNATCTENGYDRVYCKDCKKVISETVLKATGHKIVVDNKAATCTADGYHKETCSVCKTVIKNEVIKATGHQHKKTDTLAATCTTDGYIRETCTDCGMLIKETILKAKGHKYVNDIKQATCTEDGYMRYQCSVCKYCTKTTVIKALGHAWGPWKVVKEATYRSEGLKRSTCGACGAYKDQVIPMIAVPVQKIVLVPEEDFSMPCKKTDRLQATVYPEEAAYSADIVWTSSNSNVVTVSDDGTITAKRRGKAVITAATKDGKVKATRTVTVEYTLIQWIIIYLLFGWIWYL